MRRFLLTSLLVLGMCGVVIGHAASPAHAASACQSSPSHANCDGIDPHWSGCDSTASVVTSKPIYSPDNPVNAAGYVYTMWSSQCSTNWARLVMTSGIQPLAMYTQLYVLNFNSQGYYSSRTYLYLQTDGPDHCNGCGGSTSYYGNMYYAPTAEVEADGWASISDGIAGPGCPFTGASWRYTYSKPACTTTTYSGE